MYEHCMCVCLCMCKCLNESFKSEMEVTLECFGSSDSLTFGFVCETSRVLSGPTDSSNIRPVIHHN